MGTVSVTAGGKQCQKWSSNTPHVVTINYTDDTFPDGSRVAAQNYCRNPDPTFTYGVWCYTMDPYHEYDHCDVPLCSK